MFPLHARHLCTAFVVGAWTLPSQAVAGTTARSAGLDVGTATTGLEQGAKAPLPLGGVGMEGLGIALATNPFRGSPALAGGSRLPVHSEQAQPEQAQPEQAQPEQAQPDQAQSDQAQSDQAQSGQAQPEQALSEQASRLEPETTGSVPAPVELGAPPMSVPSSEPASPPSTTGVAPRQQRQAPEPTDRSVTSNPKGFTLVGRLLFANSGGAGAPGGRLAGAMLDVGQSFAYVGYALTASAWIGRHVLRPNDGAELGGLVGLGPTLSLGRLAVIERGFLDLRVGYDIYYGVVNRRQGGGSLRPQATPELSLTPARNVVPHGPRVRLDLGLLSRSPSRRFSHGLGVSLGYQALVGSLHHAMPVIHLLTLGVTYRLG